MIPSLLILSVFTLACALFAAWRGYKLIANLLEKISTYKGYPPVPSKYTLNELKFSYSTEEI